jgi:TatD DNase family protein
MESLVDIGCNLTHDSFDHDREAVLQRANDAGIHRLLVTGTSVDSSTAAVRLAQRHSACLFATAGLHPHNASAFDATQAESLRNLARQPEVVAVGECGLDYFRNYSPREDQATAFEAQLAIAVEVHKPVFLHQRDAHDPFVQILSSYLPRIPGGVAHCFTGDQEDMREYLDMGLYIGITGWICDERRAASLRDAVSVLPLDRVLLETDAPYLLPRSLKDKPTGRRNEPALLAHILQVAAHYMNITPARLAAAATQNTEKLFGLAPVTP